MSEIKKSSKKITNKDTQVVKGRRLTGRKQIFTNESEITFANVVKVLSEALHEHQRNRSDIEYLFNYVRGVQPIIDRVKIYNKEICNRIVINRANEIVTFKTANFIGEPLQYVSRGAETAVPKNIETLNQFMLSENKASKDMELAHNMFTCGVGYRLILNDKAIDYAEDDLFDEAPFEIYTLDPRNTFIVRRNDVTKKVLMGVSYVYKTDSEIEYTVYTKDTVYTIKGSVLSAGEIIREEKYNFGMVPIVEYPCNTLRMGAFEPVIDLLDAINLTESNRMDGVEQFIQAVMVFENVDITSEQLNELKAQGAIKVFSKDGNVAKVYYLNEQLDQTQTQTLMDDMYQIVLQIVGMPSQGNANTSDSSNNGAVIMKNGWWNAEARAKETVGMWTLSETESLKIILKICQEADALSLKLSDIQFKYARQAYSDLWTKVQSFVALIGAGCTPEQAFRISGLVTDPTSEALVFEKYSEEEKADLEEQLKQASSTQVITEQSRKEGQATVEVEAEKEDAVNGNNG